MALMWLSRNIATSPESPELDGFNTGETAVTSMTVQDRGSFANPNPMDNEIIGMLEGVAKAMELKELPEDAKSLVTLDRIKGNPSAITISLEKLLDIQTVKTDKKNNRKERFYEGNGRIAVVSPLFISDRGLKLKLALIHPPRFNGNRDAKKLYQQCIDTSFRSSNDLIDRMKSKSSSDPVQMADHLRVNVAKDQSFFEPQNMSFESRLKILLDKAFELAKTNDGRSIALKRLDTDLFERQLIARLKEAKQLIQIIPGYHVIASEVSLNDRGEYLSKPEVVTHYEMMKIALQNSVLYKLKEVAQKNNQTTWLNKPQEPGDEGLIDLIKSFPWNAFNSEAGLLFKNQAMKAIEILEALATHQSQVSSQKEEKKVNQYVARYIEKIKENSKNEAIRDLTRINFETEAFESVKMREQVTQMLLDKMGGVLKNDSDGQTRAWFVHPHYLAYVEVNLAEHAEKDKNYRMRYEILKEINNKLENHPELNKGIEPKQLAEFKKLIGVYEKRVENEKSRETVRKNGETPWGSHFLSGIYFSLLGAGGLAFGWFAGILLGVIGTALFIKAIKPVLYPKVGQAKQKSESKESDGNSLSDDQLSQQLATNGSQNSSNELSEAELKKQKAEQQFSANLQKYLIQTFIPEKFDHLPELMFSSNEILDRKAEIAAKFPRMKAALNDDQKFIATLNAAAKDIVRIRVHDGILKKNSKAPTYWYLRLSDWSHRTRVADQLRDGDVNKDSRYYGDDMCKYLIQCLEMRSQEKLIWDKKIWIPRK